MTETSRHLADADGVTVHVYATMDGRRVSARWTGGSVCGDSALCDCLDGPVHDPLEFINECERVVGGPVGVAIGQLAQPS